MAVFRTSHVNQLRLQARPLLAYVQEDRVAMFRAICSTDFKFPAHFSKVGAHTGVGRLGTLVASCFHQHASLPRQAHESKARIARHDASAQLQRNQPLQALVKCPTHALSRPPLQLLPY